MKNNINLIIDELYQNYYVKDNTPEHVISSHWKFYQEKIKCELNGGKITSLSWLGFGDLQNKSFLSQTFSWLTIAGYLCQFPNRNELLRLMKLAVPLGRKIGFPFSYDCFRQICSLKLIMNKLKNERERVNIIIIGDGYGFLGALIKEIFPNSLICLIDLGKSLLVQACCCGKAYPHSSHRLVSESSGTINRSDSEFLYCPAEFLEELDKYSFDVAINIASMQEMNQPSINTYFDFLRCHMPPDNLFYCCNRKEKEMPGGEVSRFSEYPWQSKDIHLVDEFCPWHSYFASWGKTKNGPRFLGIRIPFINYFDGPIIHRLTILQTFSH